MNTSITETIECACGTVFQWENETDNDIARFFRPSRCSDCEEKRAAEFAAKEAERAAEKAKEREEWISINKIEVAAKVREQTPDLFKRTDTNHQKFNRQAWMKIENHRLTEDFPWIGFVGMTGRCKTRMAYLYAAKEIERLTDTQRASFAFVASYEITDAVTRLNCSFEAKDEARTFLDRLRDVDVLLIDDLGKGRLTATVASELFALMDYRHVHQARTIWTSNSTPEAIVAGLPEDMAGPFVGRIMGSSKIFTFK